LSEALGLDDVIFEIDNKSMTNRPDLWSHYGVAREIAALTGKKFKTIKPPMILEGNTIKISVKNGAKDLCSRYMAVAMNDVSPIASPEWLRARLEAIGQRSINAIVDLTNYVMFELGQPLHAFDADKIGNHNGEVALTVRLANAGENFITLDAKKLTLTNTTLAIANDTEILALAGIKGGENSGVDTKTTRVIFEAATFNAGSVRKTSTALGIRTDSSARFEKSLDPHLPAVALRRVVELAQKIWPMATVASIVVDITNFSSTPIIVNLTCSFINERLGVQIEEKKIVNILERLGFAVVRKKDALAVTVPSWRATKDISIKEDIVEEVVRLYGYENIPAEFPLCQIAPAAPNELRNLEREIKEILARECGFTEVYNYSFASSEWLARLGLSTENFLALDNPIAKDRPLLRRDLIPGLLENIEYNAHRFDNVSLFEIGRVYRSDTAGERARQNSGELLPDQPLMLGLAVLEKNNNQPFFILADAIRNIGERLGYFFSFSEMENSLPLFHPGRIAHIMCGEIELGKIAEIHPEKQLKLGIDARVAVAEFSLSALLLLASTPRRYVSIPNFPEVERDIAIIVDKKKSHSEIETIMLGAHSLLQRVELFDIYEDTQIGPDKKSIAYHVTYASDDHTLATAEIDAAQAVILKILTKKCGAMLRGE